MMSLAQLDSRGALAEIGTSSHPAEVQGDLTIASNSHRNNQGSYNTQNHTVNVNITSPVASETLVSMMNTLVMNPNNSGQAYSRSVVTTASPTSAGDQSAAISEVVQTPTQTRFSTSEAPTMPMTPVDAGEGDVGDSVPDIDVCIKLVPLVPENVALPDYTGVFAKRYVQTAIYESNKKSISIWEPNPRKMPNEADLGYAMYPGDVGRFDFTGSFETYFNIIFDSKMNKRLGYNPPKNFRPFRSSDPVNEPLLRYGHYTGPQALARGFDVTEETDEIFTVKPLSGSTGKVGSSARVACIIRDARRTFVQIARHHFKPLEKYTSRYISDWEEKFTVEDHLKGRYGQLVIISMSYRVSGFGSASSDSGYEEIKSMSATIDLKQHPPRWKFHTFAKGVSLNSVDTHEWSEEAKRKDRFGDHPPGHCVAVNAWKIVRKPPGGFSKASLFSITSITSTASGKIQRILSRR